MSDRMNFDSDNDAHEGRGHYKLDAWKVSMELVRRVYEFTKIFPKDEMFGLSVQMRRSAVSIPSNVAEGAARTGDREFAHFLSIARGSLSELETQLPIAADLKHIDPREPVFDLVDRVSRLITGLHKVMRT